MSESGASPLQSLIKLLDPVIANKIAAGEVVQRPGSVVKELLDNAIDAGADRIQVLILQAGRNLIQVTDNGAGMSADDLRMCFVRHATSKIAEVDDLFRIRTLGFRGEAMPSIASVAQVNVLTKRLEDDNGHEMEIWGGEERKLQPVACQNGTTVAVRNLFYNVPARRAFLKTDATEFRQILQVFQQAALANPEVDFELVADGERIYRLPAASLEDRIVDIFGKSYRASLIPVEESTSMVRVSGFVGDPKLVRRNRGEQFLFVNGRPFQHRFLSFAVQSTYSGWLSTGEFPFYAIFFEIDPSALDVNVHPAKMEVKFEDEKSIINVTKSVVTRALNSRFQVPVPESRGLGLETDHGFGGGFNFRAEPGPFHGQETTSVRIPSRMNFDTASIPSNATEMLYGDVQQQPVESQRNTSFDKGNGFWQLHHSYVLAQTRNGLCLVDQNRAHRRILYEKALQAFESSLPTTQQLLFPVNVSFSASDFAVLKELLETIRNLGFDVQLLSGNSALLSGVPADIGAGGEQKLLEGILQEYHEFERKLRIDARERLAMAYAYKTAIPKGKKMDLSEMESLVDQLFSCSQPFFDPTQKPTMVLMSLDELSKLFHGAS